MNDNELIATFMGMTVCECDPNKEKHYRFGERNWEVHAVSEMRYETSWDWLMPVVEKIDKLGHDIDLFWHSSMKDGMEYRHTTCAIQDRPSFKAITCQEASPMILAVYKAVVEFIKWLAKEKGITI